MSAIVVTETGGPAVLACVDGPAPQAGPGELLVKVAAAGVNFVDTYHRAGAYRRPLPFTPGQEFAGTVDAVGDRVASVDSKTGAYADYTLVNAARIVHVPDAVPLETAAAAMLQGLTAH